MQGNVADWMRGLPFDEFCEIIACLLNMPLGSPQYSRLCEFLSGDMNLYDRPGNPGIRTALTELGYSFRH